jgi:hypothetical protein
MSARQGYQPSDSRDLAAIEGSRGRLEALDIPDYQLNTLGARGIAEIRNYGNGRGRLQGDFSCDWQVRSDLPVTPDELI